jgi:hypothetical protein
MDLVLHLLPTAYTLRHARGPVNQPSVSKDGLLWTTLFTHVDDCFLNEPGSTSTWPLEPPRMRRDPRMQQHPHPADEKKRLGTDALPQRQRIGTLRNGEGRAAQLTTAGLTSRRFQFIPDGSRRSIRFEIGASYDPDTTQQKHVKTAAADGSHRFVSSTLSGKTSSALKTINLDKSCTWLATGVLRRIERGRLVSYRPRCSSTPPSMITPSSSTGS